MNLYLAELPKLMDTILQILQEITDQLGRMDETRREAEDRIIREMRSIEDHHKHSLELVREELVAITAGFHKLTETFIELNRRQTELLNKSLGGDPPDTPTPPGPRAVP